MKQVLVLYYSQTGQTTEIVNRFIAPLREHDHVNVVVEEIKPLHHFPYPWGNAENFFQAFPESRMSIPCEIEPIQNLHNNFDLIILAYQPWYLSPSIPTHGLFHSPEINTLFKGKPVVTIMGCRNMWVKAQERIKEYLYNADAKLVGNVVLRDKAPNLPSVISVVRWMIWGKKERWGIIPPSGVSEEDIASVSRYGEMLCNAINTNDYSNLQDQYIKEKAVEYLPGIVSIEEKGHRLFGIWAKFVLKKGGFGDKKRSLRLKFFKYYLFTMLYVLSPFFSFFHWLFRPIFWPLIKKKKAYYLQVNYKKK